MKRAFDVYRARRINIHWLGLFNINQNDTSTVKPFTAEVKNGGTLWDTAASAGVRGFPVTVINVCVIFHRPKMKTG